MSKCWYCNEELTTGNNPEHLGICDKCYNEMFKCGNEFIRNMVTKIADLEAKLAEKDAELEQKNKLIIQENGECILCGDCYCINNDVRKIVEENKQLSQIKKQEIIWLKEFDGLFEKGKDYEDVWQFLIDRITLVNGERYAD